MEIKFTKMEGLGNDFILLDDRDGKIKKFMAYPQLAEQLCSRHFGIGADGILLMLDSSTLDMKFHIYNSDGSQAQMCGNGIRCFAKYLYENRIITQKRIRVETEAGKVIPEVVLDGKGQVTSVRVDMGEPVLLCKDIPFEGEHEMAIEERLIVGKQKYEISAVSMGNPHAVIFVDDVGFIIWMHKGKLGHFNRTKHF
jgi:diaminopimelate epimerase